MMTKILENTCGLTNKEKGNGKNRKRKLRDSQYLSSFWRDVLKVKLQIPSLEVDREKVILIIYEKKNHECGYRSCQFCNQVEIL